MHHQEQLRCHRRKELLPSTPNSLSPPPKIRPLRNISTDSLESIPSPEASSVVSKLLPDLVPVSPPALGIQTPRHILFEGFPLIKGKTEPPRVPSNDQIELIRRLFDGVTEVSLNASFLIVRCRSLPPKPWPLTIGGMPLWLLTVLRIHRCQMANPTFRSCVTRARSFQDSLSGCLLLLQSTFLENLGLSMSEIICGVGIYLRLKVPESVHLSTLPFHDWRSLGALRSQQCHS